MAFSDFSLPFNFSKEFDLNSIDIAKWIHESNLTTDVNLKKASQQEIILKITLYVIAILVAVIGNLTVIVVITATKTLRTKFNFYILNLAVVDLLIPLTCMWLHLIHDLNPTSWPLGSFFCRINPFMQVTVVCVAIFTLTVTVVDRFCTTLYPSVLNVTQKYQIIIIICVWLMGVSLSLPWLFYTKMSTYEWFGGPQTVCQAHFPSEESRRIYITVLVCLGYVLPLTIMFVLVVITYKKVEPLRQPVTDALQTYIDSRRTALHMVFTVLIVFFICWTPQQFLKLWDEYRFRGIDAKKPKGIETFAFISFYMGYLNSCINPIICMAYNKCLRQATSELVTCKRRRVSSNSVAPVIATESMDPTNSQEQGNLDSSELNTVTSSS